MCRGSNSKLIKSMELFLLGSNPASAELSQLLHTLMCAKDEGSSPYFRLMVVLHLPRLAGHSYNQVFLSFTPTLVAGSIGSSHGFNF